LQAKEGWAAAHSPQCVVVLATELDERLIAEGWAREIVHAIQTRRRELNCEYTDRIVVGIVTDDPQLQAAARDFAEYIQRETLAIEIRFEPLPGVEPIELKLGAATLKLYVKVVRKQP
jgi:isoleucyl-tRNA synthetase